MLLQCIFFLPNNPRIITAIFVFIFFGLIAVPGTFYLQSGIILDIDSIIIGSSIGFIAVAILCVNNVRDIDTDIKVGKKTLAVRFGTVSYTHLTLPTKRIV